MLNPSLATALPPSLSQSLAQQGFALAPNFLSSTECDHIAEQLQCSSKPAGSTRCLLQQSWCVDLAEQLHRRASQAELLTSSHAAVQCTYFEKSLATNWLVAMHQDLSIPVAKKISHPALRGWSQKENTLFVQAPVALLQQLVAIRLHIDHCFDDDGPLRVVPGSHLQKQISPAAVTSLRQTYGEVTCTGTRGTALIMRPLLLHASSKTRNQGKRRVLHFLFGPRQLQYGLQWRQAV